MICQLLLAFLVIVAIGKTDAETREHPYPFERPTFDGPDLHSYWKRGQLQRIGKRRGIDTPSPNLGSLPHWFEYDDTFADQEATESVKEDKANGQVNSSNLNSTLLQLQSSGSNSRRSILKRKRFNKRPLMSVPTTESSFPIYDEDYYYDRDYYEDYSVSTSKPSVHPASLSLALKAMHNQEKKKKVLSRRRELSRFRKRGPSSSLYRSSTGDLVGEKDKDYYYDDYYYATDPSEYSTTESPRRRKDQKSNRRDSGYGGSGHASGGYGGNGLNPLALLVAPLAAISLLSAAAAVALNPVLVSISVSGRKKRDTQELFNEIERTAGFFATPDMEEKLEEMKVLEGFLGKMESNDTHQQKLLSMYLSCSGYIDDDNHCLDRVVCEYSAPDSALDQEERDVISIILYHIMSNDYISEDFKKRLRVAAKVGRTNPFKTTDDENIKNHKIDTCAIKYHCNQLD